MIDLQEAHVKNTCEENKSWCGEILDIDFYFTDCERAIINCLMNQGKYKVCSRCKEMIIFLLTKE